MVDKENETAGGNAGVAPKRGKLQTPPDGKRYVVDASSGCVVRSAMSLKSRVVGRLAHCETVVVQGDSILESASGASRLRVVWPLRGWIGASKVVSAERVDELAARSAGEAETAAPAEIGDAALVAALAAPQTADASVGGSEFWEVVQAPECLVLSAPRDAAAVVDRVPAGDIVEAVAGERPGGWVRLVGRGERYVLTRDPDRYGGRPRLQRWTVPGSGYVGEVMPPPPPKECLFQFDREGRRLDAALAQPRAGDAPAGARTYVVSGAAGAAVRAGVELDSAPVGEVRHRCDVLASEVVTSTCGRKRLRVHAPLDGWASLKLFERKVGWPLFQRCVVSSALAKGDDLLLYPDADLAGPPVGIVRRDDRVDASRACHAGGGDGATRVVCVAGASKHVGAACPDAKIRRPLRGWVRAETLASERTLAELPKHAALRPPWAAETSPEALFVKFAKRRLGLANLVAGTGCLDVGGGSGMVAVLARRLGARATLIDPSAPSGGADGFCSWTRKEMEDLEKRREDGAGDRSWWHEGSDVAPFPGLNVIRAKFGRAPLSGHQHRRRSAAKRGGKWVFDLRGGHPSHLLVDGDDDDADDLDLARGAVATRKAHETRLAELPAAANFNEFASQRKLPPPGPADVRLRASDVVNRCGAVLGYRACAAVPALVEFAVEHKKPFCVLPCCVYNVNGERPASLAAMTDALQAMHANIKQENVDGAGTVLWCTWGRPWR